MTLTPRIKLQLLFLLMILACLPQGLLARPDSIYLKVRIFANKNLSQLSVSPGQGNYSMTAGNNKATALPMNTTLLFTAIGKKIKIKKSGKNLGSFDTIKILSPGWNGLLKIKTGKQEKKYDDNIILYASSGKIIVINRVELEHYTAGVVQSEGGDAKNLEFFKLQCLISRTYALKNVRKHEGEAYQLCDQVHCQLYRGHSSRQDILDAVNNTRGLVILGPDTQLIAAAFHSNSGGETCNSEDVWSLPAVYLKAVPDSFSLDMPMARWEKKIPKDQWIKNLKKKYNFPVGDRKLLDSALHFTQPHRLTYYPGGIPLKELRNDFNLRSTFFDIEDQGELLILRGKGYGHGVGLSQEGAIRMAKDGYPYREILKFYYKDITITTVDTAMIPKKK